MTAGAASLLTDWQYQAPMVPSDHSLQRWYRDDELYPAAGVRVYRRDDGKHQLQLKLSMFQPDGDASFTKLIPLCQVVALRNALNDAIADMCVIQKVVTP